MNDQALNPTAGRRVSAPARAAKRKSIAAKTEEWLNGAADGCYCDECIAQKIGTNDRRKVQATTIRLGTQNASSKYHGRCSLCGQVTLVTSINRNWI
jgi:hypothetical protein